MTSYVIGVGPTTLAVHVCIVVPRVQLICSVLIYFTFDQHLLAEYACDMLGGGPSNSGGCVRPGGQKTKVHPE
jgi:hypothetical protein